MKNSRRTMIKEAINEASKDLDEITSNLSDREFSAFMIGMSYFQVKEKNYLKEKLSDPEKKSLDTVLQAFEILGIEPNLRRIT